MKPEHSYSKYKHGDEVMHGEDRCIVMGSEWQFYGKGYSFYRYEIYFPAHDSSLSWVNEADLTPTHKQTKGEK